MASVKLYHLYGLLEQGIKKEFLKRKNYMIDSQDGAVWIMIRFLRWIIAVQTPCGSKKVASVIALSLVTCIKAHHCLCIIGEESAPRVLCI
jgi:hypothetical protein